MKRSRSMRVKSAKRRKITQSSGKKMSALMFLAHSCLMGEQATPATESVESIAVETTPPISTNETSTQTPIVESKRKANTIITPFCLDPSHAVSCKASMQRQRHTCFKCFREDWKLLKSNPFITPWQLSRVLGSMTRQYACNLCVLEKADEPDITKNLPRPTHCKKHLVFFQQTMCTKHDKPWTRCDVCLHDPRAATSCCNFCGKTRPRNCGCPRGPIAMRDAVVRTARRLPEEQIELMAQLAKDVLEYAKQLQETKGIVDPVLREARINEIKTTFQFQDTKNLHQFYSLNAMECGDEERVAICALCN